MQDYLILPVAFVAACRLPGVENKPGLEDTGPPVSTSTVATSRPDTGDPDPDSDDHTDSTSTDTGSTDDSAGSSQDTCASLGLSDYIFTYSHPEEGCDADFATDNPFAVCLALGEKSPGRGLLEVSAQVTGTDDVLIDDDIDGGRDLNGDGLPDIVLNTSTTVEILFGPVDGASSVTDADVRIQIVANDCENLDLFANGLGDSDGDGFDDLAVTGQDYSVLYVFAGPVHATTTRADAAAWLGASDAMHPYEPASGDLDGDGLDDLLLAAQPDADPGILLFQSPLAGELTTSTAEAMIFKTADSTDSYPSAGQPSSGFDLDGDGLDDLVAASWSRDDWFSVDITTGPISGTLASDDADEHVPFCCDQGAVNAALVGDIEGDGLSDVLTESYIYSGGMYQGNWRLYFSSEHSGAWSTASYDVLFGVGSKSLTHATPGDLNADGAAELMLGCSDAHINSEENGMVLLLSSPTPGTYDWDPADPVTWSEWPGDELWLYGYEGYAQLGDGLSGAGDQNGDGIGDILIAAPAYMTEDSQSSVWLALMGI